MPALLEACLQVYPLLPPLSLPQTVIKSLHGVGLGVIAHVTHVVNTVRTVLTEVVDQEVYLLFPGLWRRRFVLVC